MSILDQVRLLGDEDSLNAGDRIQFILSAICAPFAGIDENIVACAFQNAGGLEIIGFQAPLTGLGVQFTASVTGAIQAGQLRGQILTAASQINSCKAVPCTGWTLVADAINQIVQQGTGVTGAVDALQGGIQSAGSTLALVALAIIAVVVFVAVRRV